jgi:hypothetical protein
MLLFQGTMHAFAWELWDTTATSSMENRRYKRYQNVDAL